MRTRQCASCGHRASENARFCERCGAALTPTAEPLRAPSSLEARILEQRSGIEGERKQVTVMYADVVGSMELTRTLQAERWGFVLDRFLALAAKAVHAFEGTVNQFTGDGLLAVFGAPLAHEDHARRACLAVLELQREVAALAADVADRDGARFAIRCGLNSGEVVVGAIGNDVHMDFVPLGNTTALGKRIESLAPPGSIAISASTAGLVAGEFSLRDLGTFAVKGDGPQQVWELAGLGAAQTRLGAVAATRGLSRFVGREDERAALERALERALAGDGLAVGVVGEAGVGKSRLVHEFVAGCAARGVPVTATAAVAHGRYVPLLPVLALYRTYFGITADDAPEAARARIESTMLAIDPAFADELPLLFDFLGVPDPDRPLAGADARERERRILDLLTRTVRERGRREPVVLVVEDLHWLDAASAAFLSALVAAVAGTRTLLIGTHRPEHATDWARSQVQLGPLGADASGSLIGQLLGDDPSLAGLAAMIGARAAGNPFFVEELVLALSESGHLTGTRGHYRLVSELDHLGLPVTVQAGLAARIDRLGAREKALVQTMAVVGTEVPVPLLRAVCGLDARGLADAIGALAQAQWLVPGGAGGDWAFKHPLAQEVAYASQLSAHRAHAHRAVAAAIKVTYPDALEERAALLAHHCEAAGELREAAGWHADAARWAEHRAPVESVRHWRRVRALAAELGADDDGLAITARIGLLSMAWRLGVAPAEDAALPLETRTDVERWRVDLYSAGGLMHSGRERDGLAGFQDVSRRALAAGDLACALTASSGVAYASWIAGSVRHAFATLEHALYLADDDPAVGAGLAFTCPLAQATADRGQARAYMGEHEAGRRDVARAIDLAREHGDAETESAAHGKLALLEADAGHFQLALDHAELGLVIAGRMADTSHMVASSTPAAVAHAGLGHHAQALVQAQENLATIREQHLALFLEPVLLATIARCRLALGDPTRALAAAEEAVVITNARGLATVALSAPLTLAEILLAIHGVAAADRAAAVLGEGLRVARASGARLFETQLHAAREALGALR